MTVHNLSQHIVCGEGQRDQSYPLLEPEGGDGARSMEEMLNVSKKYSVVVSQDVRLISAMASERAAPPLREPVLRSGAPAPSACEIMGSHQGRIHLLVALLTSVSDQLFGAGVPNRPCNVPCQLAKFLLTGAVAINRLLIFWSPKAERSNFNLLRVTPALSRPLAQYYALIQLIEQFGIIDEGADGNNIIPVLSTPEPTVLVAIKPTVCSSMGPFDMLVPRIPPDFIGLRAPTFG